MFRRLPNQLPEDITFPSTFEELGYYVNENDQIRQTAHPERKYQYKVNRSDRVNDVLKQSMNICARREVKKRLLDLGLEEVLLPVGASKTDKHVPILASQDLKSKNRVIVFFPERNTDMGVLSYRVMGDESVNIGSIVNFVKSILQGPPSPAKSTDVDANGADSASNAPAVQAPAERPGIVIANPAQLIWYRGGNRPVTDREWLDLPRESAVHEPMRIDEDKNRVEGNKNFKEHAQYIFEHVLSAEAGKAPLCHPDAKFSIIGQEYPGSAVLEYLANNWMGWHARINCFCMINPQHSLEELFRAYDQTAVGDMAQKEMVVNFIARRCRAFRLDHQPLETVLEGREELGCNIYSAGEKLYEESCFVRCWPSVLDWIDMCYFSETFAEPLFKIPPSERKGEKSKTKSPRKPQSEEEAMATRFHAALKVSEDGKVEEVT